MQPGTRIGAVVVQRSDDTIEFAGYGVYEGDFPVGDEAIGDMSELARQIGKPVPRLLLDTGEVVWGSEVWWGTEEEVRKYMETFPVENVSFNAIRTAFTAEHQ